jgi:hypothetical protein
MFKSENIETNGEASELPKKAPLLKAGATLAGSLLEGLDHTGRG